MLIEGRVISYELPASLLLSLSVSCPLIFTILSPSSGKSNLFTLPLTPQDHYFQCECVIRRTSVDPYWGPQAFYSWFYSHLRGTPKFLDVCHSPGGLLAVGLLVVSNLVENWQTLTFQVPFHLCKINQQAIMVISACIFILYTHVHMYTYLDVCLYIMKCGWNDIVYGGWSFS